MIDHPQALLDGPAVWRPSDPPTARSSVEWLLAGAIPRLHGLAGRLGILDALTDSGTTAEAVAERQGLKPRGVRIVLDALVAAGIVGKDGGRYQDRGRGGGSDHEAALAPYHQAAADVTALRRWIEDGAEVGLNGSAPDPATREALVRLGIARSAPAEPSPASPASPAGGLVLTEAGARLFGPDGPERPGPGPGRHVDLGAYVVHAAQLLDNILDGLESSVRTGRPCISPAGSPGFFARLSETLFALNHDSARELATALVADGPCASLADVGTGSGVWSIAIAQAAPSVRVEALDMAPVLEVTRAFTQHNGVRGQYTFTPHDALGPAPLGGPYDVVVLGYLLCGLGDAASQHVVSKCARSLGDDGRLVIADFFPRPDRQGGFVEVLFSVYMLGLTSEGETHSAEEYEAWCEQAGLRVEEVALPGVSERALVARPVRARRHRSPAPDPSPDAGAVPGPDAGLAPGAAPGSGHPAPVPPGYVIDTTFAFAQSCALLAAVELDLFSWVARGATSLADLARRAEADPDALRRLVGALGSMGLLKVTGRDIEAPTVELTPISDRLLVKDRPSYIGDVALQARREWDAWISLPDIVRTGRPARDVSDPALGDGFFPDLDEHLFPLVHPLVTRVLHRLDGFAATPDARMLDLGCGVAPAAIAALQANPTARAVGLDLPQVLERARARAEACGVSSRLELRAGDLRTVELPGEPLDLVVVSHVFRIVGIETTERLLRQCRAVLKPGGALVVVEIYNDPERPWRLLPHVTSLNMLVNTAHGDAFTTAGMSGLLTRAGFDVERWDELAPDAVLVAHQPHA